MKFDPGCIYFVREQLSPGNISDFVKIGLVNESVTPEERLKQHQTGNPNLLLLEVISGAKGIPTDAVHYVEKKLHTRFAVHRIAGEWFKLGEQKLLEEAIRHALDLAGDIGSKMPTVNSAAELDEILSDSEAISQNSELLEIASSLFAADSHIKSLRKLVKEINEFYINEENDETAEEIAKYVKIIDIYPDAKFDPKRFIANQPSHVVEQYASHYQAIKSSFKFNTAFKKTFVGDAAYDSALEDYKSSIALAKSQSSFFELSNIKENLERDIKALEWPIVYFESQLKVACGRASGIEGILSWSRTLEDKTEYDFGRLYAENPSLYLDPKHFSQQKPSKRALKVYRKNS